MIIPKAGAYALLMAAADAGHWPAPATLRSAPSSWEARLNSGSPAILVPVIAVLLRMSTAYWQEVLVPSVCGLSTSLPRVSDVPTLASFSSVWSSTRAWLPPEQEDQFFQ